MNKTDVGDLFTTFSSKKSAVNCFVYVESMYSSLRSCLKQYEAWGGLQLQWKGIDDVVATRIQVGTKKKLNEGPKGKPCKAYYTPELTEHVKKLDRGVFTSFGYETVC